MGNVIAERNLLFRSDTEYQPVSIQIDKPSLDDDGLFRVYVSFSKLNKFNSVAKGIDEFHAIECALIYINAICKNSDDPKFFWSEDDCLFGKETGLGGIL